MPVVARVGADDGHQVLVCADAHDLDRLVHAVWPTVTHIVDAVHLLDHCRQVLVSGARPQHQRWNIAEVGVIAKRRPTGGGLPGGAAA